MYTMLSAIHSSHEYSVNEVVFFDFVLSAAGVECVLTLVTTIGRVCLIQGILRNFQEKLPVIYRTDVKVTCIGYTIGKGHTIYV